MKRHLDNLEGAFPLLIIGGVLVVYAGILASQEIGSKSAHLPLWGLLGGVGAVIVGAGIYSTFLPSERHGPEAQSGDWVTVPRADWEAAKSRLGPAPRSVGLPIWWEGPPERVEVAGTPVRSVRPISETTRRHVMAPAAGSAIGRPTEDTPEAGRPRPTRNSLQELRKTLDELEAMAGAPPGTSLRAARLSGAHTVTACVDCDRAFPAGHSSARCPGCGRGLCGHCVELSRAEDGVVRCNECRARDS